MTLTLTASDEAPVYGQAVTLTAQVAGSGTVQFTDGGAIIGSAALVSGAARLTVSTLTAGPHTIAASLGTASAQVVVTVSRMRTATALAWSGGLAVGDGICRGGAPSGSVRFVTPSNGSAIAVAPVASGRASVPWVGDSLVAVYAGDENFLGSISGAVSPLAAANAASYEAESFAPDEIVTLFGRNLAAVKSAQVTDSGGTVRQAQVLYAAAEQASVVMPEDVAPGPAVLAGWGDVRRTHLSEHVARLLHG